MSELAGVTGANVKNLFLKARCRDTTGKMYTGILRDLQALRALTGQKKSHVSDFEIGWHTLRPEGCALHVCKQFPVLLPDST